MKSNGRIFIFHVSLDSLYFTLVFYAIDAANAYARSYRHQDNYITSHRLTFNVNINIRYVPWRSRENKLTAFKTYIVKTVLFVGEKKYLLHFIYKKIYINNIYLVYMWVNIFIYMKNACSFSRVSTVSREPDSITHMKEHVSMWDFTLVGGPGGAILFQMKGAPLSF